METLENTTFTGLAETLGLSVEKMPASLSEMASSDNRYLKDLKINIGNVLKFESLTEKEKWLLALSVSVNDKHKDLQNAILEKLNGAGVSAEEIQETYACVSLLNINNVFYRFRHFTKKEFYETTPAGIKMSIMLNPKMGKELFELVSLVVSALNGCELCVGSHEESLIKLGISQQKIYDAVRLGAVMRGFTVLD